MTPYIEWIHYYGVVFPDSLGLKGVLFFCDQITPLLVNLGKEYLNGRLITQEPDYSSELGGCGGGGGGITLKIPGRLREYLGKE